MDNTKSTQNRSSVIIKYTAALFPVFLAMLVFFGWKHPLYIYDTDDWFYISRVRLGVPIPNYWNPTRILPEVLLPLTAELGVDLILPITGDYIGSIAAACALVLSLFITIYIGYLIHFLKQENHLSSNLLLFLIPGMLMLQFLPFFTSYFGYAHMFYAQDVSCIFYYTISSLLNAVLVLHFWHDEKHVWSNPNRFLQNGLLILCIYLALFSNLFQSIIFMSYVGTVLSQRLLRILLRKKKEKHYLLTYIKQNLDYLLILLTWFVVLVLEARGGRSHSLQTGSALPWKTALSIYCAALAHLHKFFLLLIAGALAFALLLYFLHRSKEKKQNSLQAEADKRFLTNVLRIAFCFFLTSIFLILLCAKVNADYMAKPAVLFGILFYLILLFTVCLGYILQCLPQLALILPIAFFVLASELVVTRTNYADIYVPAVTRQIDEDIISQVLSAEKAGLTEITVQYPDNGSIIWPFDIWNGGEKIANTLYRHGITQRQMVIHLEPSAQMYTKYGPIE